MRGYLYRGPAGGRRQAAGAKGAVDPVIGVQPTPANTANTAHLAPLTVPNVDGTFALGTGTAGQVPFWNNTNVLGGDAGLVWDNVNKILNVNGPTFVGYGEKMNVNGPMICKGLWVGNGASTYILDFLGTKGANAPIIRAGVSGFSNGFTIYYYSSGPERLVYTFIDGNVLIGTGYDGMTPGGSLAIQYDLAHRGSLAGFFGTAPVSKPAVTGSRGGNTALASLLTALAGLGLIANNTTA